MNRDVRIFWIGDSTVHQNRIDSYPQAGIGQMLTLYLKRNVSVQNYGKNGRSSKSFLLEGHFQAVAEKMQKHDFLFIQFGHNDNKPSSAGYTAADGDFKEYLQKYVTSGKEKGAYPLIITPLARRHFDAAGNYMAGSHGDYPRAAMEAALAEEIPFLDLTRKSEALLQKAGQEKSRKWFMNLEPGEFRHPRLSKGLLDNTHLTYTGAVVMAGLIARELKQLAPPFRQLIMDFVEDDYEALI